MLEPVVESNRGKLLALSRGTVNAHYCRVDRATFSYYRGPFVSLNGACLFHSPAVFIGIDRRPVLTKPIETCFSGLKQADPSSEARAEHCFFQLPKHGLDVHFYVKYLMRSCTLPNQIIALNWISKRLIWPP